MKYKYSFINATINELKVGDAVRVKKNLRELGESSALITNRMLDYEGMVYKIIGINTYSDYIYLDHYDNIAPFRPEYGGQYWAWNADCLEKRIKVGRVPKYKVGDMFDEIVTHRRYVNTEVIEIRDNTDKEANTFTYRMLSEDDVRFYVNENILDASNKKTSKKGNVSNNWILISTQQCDEVIEETNVTPTTKHIEKAESLMPYTTDTTINPDNYFHTRKYGSRKTIVGNLTTQTLVVNYRYANSVGDSECLRFFGRTRKSVKRLFRQELKKREEWHRI